MALLHTFADGLRKHECLSEVGLRSCKLRQQQQQQQQQL
jgi:hypothetical protein